MAIEGLDTLESLIDEPALAERFLHWLSDSRNYDPVWSVNDAEWVKLRITYRLGKEREFAFLINQVFYRLRDEDPKSAEQTARLLIDWNIDPSQGQQLLDRLPKDRLQSENKGYEARLRGASEVSVLFIGGNEIQAQYDAEIISEIKRTWPGCKIQFAHTGWSSNWGRQVDGLVRIGNECDAVVIMRMIRTLLGRTLRERLTKPWIPCTGTGKTALLQSIREAGIVGLKQREMALGV